MHLKTLIDNPSLTHIRKAGYDPDCDLNCWKAKLLARVEAFQNILLSR